MWRRRNFVIITLLHAISVHAVHAAGTWWRLELAWMLKQGFCAPVRQDVLHQWMSEASLCCTPASSVVLQDVLSLWQYTHHPLYVPKAITELCLNRSCWWQASKTSRFSWIMVGILECLLTSMLLSPARPLMLVTMTRTLRKPSTRPRCRYRITFNI